MGDNVSVIDVPPVPDVIRAPALVLAEAKQAADELVKVVREKNLAKKFGGDHEHLQFEAWQTVGKFYGITPKVVSTEFVQFGDAQGFEAKAVAVNRDGMEISAATALCLNDEDKWSTRTKYEWQTVNGKRERVAVGEVRVPIFQLASMAQTRACSKVLRNVLAWVVVLAGFSPTPAEEMTDTESANQELSKTDRMKAAVGSGAPPAGQANAAAGKPTELEELKALLAELSGRNAGKAKALLREASLFVGNDGKEKFIESVDGFGNRPNWIRSTLGKLRKLAETMEDAPAKDGCAENGPACSAFGTDGSCERFGGGCSYV